MDAVAALFICFLPESSVFVSTIAFLLFISTLSVNPFGKCEKPRIHCKNSKLASFLESSLPILREQSRIPLYATSSTLNTIISSLIRDRLPRLNYERELLRTPDGGTLGLDWLPVLPQSNVDAPVALFVHGYIGDSQADYLKMLAPIAQKSGFRVAAMNQRGRGGVKLTSTKVHSLVDTEDIGIVVDHIKKTHPTSALFCIAFSIGGALVTKYLTKACRRNNCKIDALLCVSSPLESSRVMAGFEANLVNRLISRYMAWYYVGYIKASEDMLLTHDVFKGNAKAFERVLRAKSIRETQLRFDLPVNGIESLAQYYSGIEALGSLHEITIPVVFLNSVDDTVVPIDSLPVEEIASHRSMAAITTRFGGHVGFLERGFLPSFWLGRFCEQFFPALRHANLREHGDAPLDYAPHSRDLRC